MEVQHAGSGEPITSGFQSMPTRRQITKAYFANIYPAEWDGGYDVDRYPSYGAHFRNSGRPAAAHLERLGVFDLADRQEAFSRSIDECSAQPQDLPRRCR